MLITVLVRAAAWRCADGSLGLDTAQEPGEASPIKGLRLAGEETEAARKERPPRCCTGGCFREAGLSPFYPRFGKAEVLIFLHLLFLSCVA